MSDKDKQWTVEIKEIPHHFAVMIKDIEKASGMHKASAKREELLEKVRNQLDDIIQNSPSNNFKKIDDYLRNDPEKTTLISNDPPYTREIKRYCNKPITTKKSTPKKKTTKKKTTKRKTRKDKGVKRGPNKRTTSKKKK